MNSHRSRSQEAEVIFGNLADVAENFQQSQPQRLHGA